MTNLILHIHVKRHMLKSVFRWLQVPLFVLLLFSPCMWGAEFPAQQSTPRDPAAEILDLRKQIQKLLDEDRASDAAHLMLKAQELEEAEIEHYNLLIRDAAQNADWQSAILSARKVLRFRERLYGENSPTLVLTLSNLTHFYTAAGDYARADYYLQRLLPFITNLTANPPNNPQLAVVFHNVGAALASRGQYQRADVFYQALLRIREHDPESLEHVAALNGIALLHQNMKDTQGAEAYFNRALKILEAKKLFVANLQRTLNPNAGKPFDEGLANVLNSLAFVEHAKGDFDGASRDYTRAIELADKVFGPDSITAAAYRENLALLRKDEKKYAEAESLYKTVKAVVERKLGPKHLATAQVDGNLAMLYMAMDDAAKALPFLASNLEIGEYDLSLNLSVGSESEKNLYVDRINGFLDSVISFHTRLAPENQDALRLSLTTILRRKGRQLDVMADTLNVLRTRANTEDVAKFIGLQSARSQLAGFVLRSRDAADPSSLSARIRSLNGQVEQLESELGQKYAEYRLATAPATIEEVQRLIPPDAALVEIVSYRPTNPKASVFATDRWGAPRYVAYILRHQGIPKWIELKTSGALIDEAVLQLRANLRSRSPESETRAIAKRVYDQVFAPIADKLDNAREILVSPDGALNLIPFAALVDHQDHFLVEKYCFSYLTSGRDLLRLNVKAQSVGAPVVVADPVFEQDKTEARQTPGSNEEAVARLSNDFHQPFDRLLGTAHEAKELSKLLKDPVLLENKEATETRLKQVNRPSLLHISTHGFFLPDEPGVSPLGSWESSSAGAANAISENPLLRSGLALSGANQLSGGNGEDGILTAYEIAGLDLRGTKLVVLSACETGLGGLQNGEGVYGLRRALLLAGAESEVVTLWKVNSEGTTELIEKYYRRLACGEGRSKALQHVQIEMLKQHPYFWAGFIPIGQWSNIPEGTFRPGAVCAQ